MAYEITWLTATVVIKLYDQVSIIELHEVINLIQGDQRFDSLKKKIFNCLEVHDTEANCSDIKVFAYIDRASVNYNKNLHTAIVVGTSKIEEMALTYIGILNGSSACGNIFHTLNDAFEWQPNTNY